jgi:hypothetical protein
MTQLLLVAALAVPPPGWTRAPQSPPDSHARHCANWSLDEWAVTSTGQDVLVRSADDSPRQDSLPFPISFLGALPENPEFPRSETRTPEEMHRQYLRWALAYAEHHARRYVVPLQKGWLVGFGAGEYGGSVFWYSSPTERTQLLGDNVVDIIPIAGGKEAMVFTGLAHMGVDKGQVFRFRLRDNAPELLLLADLGTAPRVVAPIDTSSSWLVTDHGLHQVSRDGHVRDVCQFDFSGLYPNSLALQSSGHIWVGMRRFIVSLQPHTSGRCDVEWFVRDDCLTQVPRDEGYCDCKDGMGE